MERKCSRPCTHKCVQPGDWELDNLCVAILCNKRAQLLSFLIELARCILLPQSRDRLCLFAFKVCMLAAAGSHIDFVQMYTCVGTTPHVPSRELAGLSMVKGPVQLAVERPTKQFVLEQCLQMFAKSVHACRNR